MNTVRIWWEAARPKTLPAAMAPVLMGTALAYQDGGAHAGAALAALATGLGIQVGTNFCNDYADFKKGADTVDRLGPTRATQAGWVTPAAMLRATGLAFAAAALAALYLIARGGPWLALIAVASIGAGAGYTLGRYALAYIGLGEMFVLMFFGPVALAGTYYVQTLQLPARVIGVGLAPGALSCALLAVNNLRDIEQDRRAAKRTLAVRFGPRFARLEYQWCVWLALLGLPVYLWAAFDWPVTAGVLALLWLPARHPLRAVRQGGHGAALNQVLARTGHLLIGLSIGFTLLAICFTF